MTDTKIYRLSRTHVSFANPQVEAVFHRNFTNAFKRYIRYPASVYWDVSEPLRNQKGQQRHAVFRGEIRDDGGRFHEIVVKESMPRLAKKEFSNYYRLLTGHAPFSPQDTMQRVALIRGGEIRSAAEPVSMPKPGEQELPRILVPQPIGYVIDKERDKGFIVTRYVPGHTLEQLNLDEMPTKTRWRIIEAAARIHKSLIQRKVIHADLRPRNFLVRRTQWGDSLYLLDPEFSVFTPVFTDDHRVFDFVAIKSSLAKDNPQADAPKWKLRRTDVARYLTVLFPTREERKRFVRDHRDIFPPLRKSGKER